MTHRRTPIDLVRGANLGRAWFAGAVALGLTLVAAAPAAAQDSEYVDEGEGEGAGEAPDSLESPPPAPVDDPSEESEPAPPPAPADEGSAPAPVDDGYDDRGRDDGDDDDDRRGRRSRRDREDRYDDDDGGDDDRRGRRSRRSSRRDRGDEDAAPATDAGSDFLWLWVGTAGGLFLPCGVCYSPFLGDALAGMINGSQWDYGVGSKVLASLAMIVAYFPVVLVLIIMNTAIQIGGGYLLAAAGLSALAFIPGIIGLVLGVLVGLVAIAALGALGAGVMELMKDPPRRRGDDYVMAPPPDLAPARMVQARPETAEMRF